MSILKELLQLNERQELLEEAAKKKAAKAKKTPKKKAKRAGKAGDGKHDDGTKLQFKKDRPFMKDPKTPEFVGGNMWFNMTKSGARAGDLE